MEAYVHGTSTRKVDDLVKALGVEAGTSKSEVSRICAELDGEVAGFRSRSLAHTAFPYLFLDATYLKARVDGRVVSRAVVIATGVTTDGGREVLGLDVGDSEDGAFWTAFLRSLKARGLHGVQLVVSDAHLGLRQAVAAVMAGASWQRCRVHFLRNVLARVPRGSAEMVAAAIRTIFAQPTGAEVIDQVDKVAAMLAPKFPAVAAMLTDAREDLTAFASFPTPHWVKIWSTNPLERVNKEVKRRTNVVGIFPDDAAVLRLAGAVLIEAHDERQVAERRYLSEASMAKLTQTGDDAAGPKGGEEGDRRARRHLATSPSIVTEHHDALNSTTPRDAAPDTGLAVPAAEVSRAARPATRTAIASRSVPCRRHDMRARSAPDATDLPSGRAPGSTRTGTCRTPPAAAPPGCG
jgi:transposase-like protein